MRLIVASSIHSHLLGMVGVVEVAIASGPFRVVRDEFANFVSHAAGSPILQNALFGRALLPQTRVSAAPGSQGIPRK
jgi:hypothetical protein